MLVLYILLHIQHLGLHLQIAVSHSAGPSNQTPLLQPMYIHFIICTFILFGGGDLYICLLARASDETQFFTHAR